MFISFLLQADDANPPAPIATDNQSSSDSGNKADDINVSIANIHHINLDTTQVDGGGNWLNKRLWYERAQNVFDEILVQVNSMTDLRIQFSNEANAAGHKIDTFFEEVDFTKDELDIKLKEMLASLDTEQKIIGDLSPEERTLQTTVKQEIKEIEQIGKNIKSIGQVDNKIDETMMQAFKTIDEAKDYQTKAWDTFKSIGKELDDKKARNLYYQMNNYKQNIDQKITYLKNSLLPYLHNVLVAKVDTSIAKINQSMADLKTKGVDLQKIMGKTQEDDLTDLHQREKEATDLAVRKALEEEEKKDQEDRKQQQERFERKLKEAQEKSFSNVAHGYYQATIGKVVSFFHQGYTGMSIDYIESFFSGFFRSYSYPVITYCYHTILAAKNYVENTAAKLMIHYGGKPAVKAKIVEKIEEKIEQIEKKEQPIKEAVQEKKSEKEAQSHESASTKSLDVVQSTTPDTKTPATPAVATSQVDSTTAATATSSESNSASESASSTTTTQSTNDQSPAVLASATTDQAPTTASAVAEVAPVTTTTPAVIAPSTTDQSPVLPTAPVESVATTQSADQVVVQSLAQDGNDDQTPIPTSKMYQLFKAVLDFIGTMLISLYHCVIQFFVMVWKFATYVSFAK
jgi:hypothetical protein